MDIDFDSWTEQVDRQQKLFNLQLLLLPVGTIDNLVPGATRLDSERYDQAENRIRTHCFAFQLFQSFQSKKPLIGRHCLPLIFVVIYANL